MKKIYSVVFVLLTCLSVSAQSFRTGYFLDNYIYGYRINPAATAGDSFFGLAVSNFDLQNRSSLGISSFIFPKGNTLVTGLNGSVDADTFLGGLSKSNGILLDESFNILSMGFAKEKHTSTIELNVRASGCISIPYDFFAFLKKGGLNAQYNIGDIYANVNAFADLAYGYSRKINDRLSLGARVHALVGMANVNACGNSTSISVAENELSVNTNLELSSAGLVQLGFSDGTVDLDNATAEMGSAPGGFGALVDLGAIYKPVDGLELSLSINDLGGIFWNNNATAKGNGKKSFTGGNITFENDEVTTDLEDVLDDFLETVNLKNVGETSRFEMMPMTIAAGTRYRMPFYKGLSTGVLASFHTGKYTSWYDVRLGATITPARIISATANVGVSTFGPSLGAAINACLGPLNIVLGVDSYLGKMAKLDSISVPLNPFQENIHFGLALSF